MADNCKKLIHFPGNLYPTASKSKDARNGYSPRPSVEKVFAELFSKSDYLLILNRDADAEFDYAIAGDTEELRGGDCVARHEQEQPAADEA